MNGRSSRLAAFRAAVAALIVAAFANQALAARPRIYALTGATIVPAPGQRIDSGTLVLRDPASWESGTSWERSNPGSPPH